jgi:L-ascorbate metabolism protein UlaG (beta-lactamase superfamily)
MDIEYKGANCLVITTKKATLVIDPKLSVDGLKDITPKNAIVVATQLGLLAAGEDAVIVDRPGEYEVRNISVTGIAAERMVDHDKSLQSTVYRLVVGDVSIAVIGHVATPLTEEQLETLSVVDVVIVPVGGNGYTLDAHQAVSVIRQIDPKIVIPTHYADVAIDYEVPQMDLEPFLKELGAPNHEKLSKWKSKGGISDVLTVIEIERTA